LEGGPKLYASKTRRIDKREREAYDENAIA
jgi:hypothetical protein